MKSVRLFLVFYPCLCLTATTVFAQYNSKIYVDGEVLVKFKSGTISGAARQTNDQIGASILESFADLNWQRVKLPEGLSVKDAVTRYESFAEVEYVQPNFYYHLLATPNDPQFPNSNMYGLRKFPRPGVGFVNGQFEHRRRRH